LVRQSTKTNRLFNTFNSTIPVMKRQGNCRMRKEESDDNKANDYEF
jgi:hypothetical protein